MLWNRSAAAIRTQWQTEIEGSLEAGRAPVLNLGISNSVLDNLAGLVALQALAKRRVDVTTPTVCAGGSSALWLAALMHERAARAPLRSPNITVLFAGVDMVSYMATATTLVMAHRPEPDRTPAGLPASMAPHLMPTEQMGAVVPWETAPMAMMEATSRVPQAAPSTDTSDAWITWIAIIVAIGLILFALVM